jgi:hypothetical protein
MDSGVTESLYSGIDRLERSLAYNEALLRAVATKWSTEFINSLPNSAFAVVERGYKEGNNKNARHLPHHDKSVRSATENSSVDIVHYRNALARMNQVKSVLGVETDAVLRKRAASHLGKHRAVLSKSRASMTPYQRVIWDECEKLYERDVAPLLNGD